VFIPGRLSFVNVNVNRCGINSNISRDVSRDVSIATCECYKNDMMKNEVCVGKRGCQVVSDQYHFAANSKGENGQNSTYVELTL